MTCKLKKIHDSICQQPLAVISTTDKFQNCAQSALIAFAQNEDLELFVMTFVNSRKHKNLTNHSFVSLVIGFDYLTIQYEGMAQELMGNAISTALIAFSNKKNSMYRGISQ